LKNNSNFIRQRAYIAVLHLLNSILAGGKYPDILLGELFKLEKYGILRHLRRIDHIIEHASRARIGGLHLSIINILRICTYQAMFTHTSPAGVINNAVALSGTIPKSSDFLLFRDEETRRPGNNISSINCNSQKVILFLTILTNNCKTEAQSII
jgi:hypothetical protein